jgi:hypothetical protein
MRLLGVKDEPHYGVKLIGARKANDALRWAKQLAQRARDEVER